MCVCARMKVHLGFGSKGPPHFLKIKLLVRGTILQFYFIKLHCSLNNIIDSFKSNIIITNFSTTFLQTVEILIITSSHLGHHLYHFFIYQ